MSSDTETGRESLTFINVDRVGFEAGEGVYRTVIVTVPHHIQKKSENGAIMELNVAIV